ncbi:MAG TPA: hypothetical protein DD414_04625 [Lachnospiraceae bacterium]|nr:hypothetical protein [Lachnospiraceae bacterium]
MKKLTSPCLEKHIQNAMAQLTPKITDELWDKPVEKASGNEWYLDHTSGRPYDIKKAIRLTISAAACFSIIFFLSYHMAGQRLNARIYLDVNPAIELQVNRSEKVTQAEANNSDGEIILENMNLKNTDLDTAVNAIFGSMVKHGYLNEIQNMVLLSVDCQDQARSDRLQNRLANNIIICLDTLPGSGTVFSQSIRTDSSLKSIAKTYGITPGKAGLLEKIQASNPALNLQNMAAMSMSELALYLKERGIDLKDYAGCTEKEPDDIPEPDPVYEIPIETAPREEKYKTPDPKVQETENNPVENPEPAQKNGAETKENKGTKENTPSISPPKDSMEQETDDDTDDHADNSDSENEDTDDDRDEDTDDDRDEDREEEDDSSDPDDEDPDDGDEDD